MDDPGTTYSSAGYILRPPSAGVYGASDAPPLAHGDYDPTQISMNNMSVPRPIGRLRYYDGPSEIIQGWLQHLSPTDVVAFGMASRWCKANVDAYYAHSLACLLSRFFDTEDEVTGFRRLQAVYAVLISGWCALQFFMNEKSPASPLDIFVACLHAPRVVEFLLAIGFDFVDPTIANPGSGPYTFHESVGLFLCFGRGSQRINMVASKGPPLQVILSSHCTVVMNVITHDRAYSFFPKATFDQRLGMTVPPVNGDHDVARDKYRGRGWRITRYTGAHGFQGTQGLDASNPGSDFARRTRWVGDRKCLSVTLPPVILDGIKRFVPPIEYNSWRVRAAHNHPKLTLRVLCVGPPQQRYMYCCAVPVLCRIIYSAEMRKLRREHRWSWHIIFRIIAPRILKQTSMFPFTASSTILAWYNDPENIDRILEKIERAHDEHRRRRLKTSLEN